MADAPAGPAYRIETERLVLRCFAPGDAPAFKRALDASLDHLRPWLPWTRAEPQPLASKVEVMRVYRGRFDLGLDFSYAVLDRAETELLGGTGLHPRPEPGVFEIGSWLAAAHVGKGYATELTAAVTRVGFEVLRARMIEVRCAPENTRSAVIPPRLGYTHEATLRARFDLGNGEAGAAMLFTMLAAEYPATPCASAPVRAFNAAGERLV